MRPLKNAVVEERRLTLGDASAPLGHPYFIGNGRRADVLWSADDMFVIFARMMQGNPLDFFGKSYRAKDGSVRFVKSNKPDFAKHAKWAWDTVCGRAKNKTSLFFFPRNSRGESQWAAVDFDAHGGDKMRARDLAFKAFAVLSRHDKLWLILGTSGGGGGWHLFIFSADFYRVREWTRFLREVADTIGQPVEKGVLEIFPDDTYGRCGLGIRPPGVWNAKDDSCGRIFFDGASQNIKALEQDGKCRERVYLFSLGQSSTPHEGSEGKKSGILPTANYEGSVSDFDLREARGVFRGEKGEWQTQFAITSVRSRHSKLTALVGAIFRQCAFEIAHENARLQYVEASPVPATSLENHLHEFDQAWEGLERLWLASLAQVERARFESLSTANERAAFRIVRNWSGHDTSCGDFPLAAASLGKRLGATMQTGCNIRARFCKAGILRPTAPYVRKKFAARYEWTAGDAKGSLGSLSCGEPASGHRAAGWRLSVKKEEAKKKEFSEALQRIASVAGQGAADVMERRKRAEVLAFAAMDDSDILRLQGLVIDSEWPVRRARRYRLTGAERKAWEATRASRPNE